MNDNSVFVNQGSVSALNRFFAKIYGFVGLGIGITALVSFLSVTTFRDFTLSLALAGRGAVMLLLLAEVGLVFVASAMAAKNSPLALPMFLLYSVMNGFTLSFVLFLYTIEDIYSAFLSAALMFVVMAVIGVRTKKDLSGIGQALRAALIGIIIAMVVNMFLHSSTMSYVISIISVVIFSGLIAYDNQRIRYVFEETDGQVGQGWVISMALQLYLDFVNLFLNLLRLFGSRD